MRVILSGTGAYANKHLIGWGKAGGNYQQQKHKQLFHIFCVVQCCKYIIILTHKLIKLLPLQFCKQEIIFKRKIPL